MGKKFDKLERKIEKEYLKKGYSKTRAKKIAFATAGKMARKKRR